ncbi:glycoside hydrolase family 16 protein [Aquabacterium sp.]|uniref:glycoside hydrolase family 16 protein n=1 Tax=Aquabacterium sp. TaxID=1872578 RepID=UPI003783D859
MPPFFFDDFSYATLPQLAPSGWQLREAAGHPGVPGGAWRPEAFTLEDDPQRPGNKLLRMTARTDGTPAGTVQAQICQQRKFLYGTYAARVRFTDAPVQGLDGDPVIQTFYAVSPLQHAFDPQFSEVDWEYLPNGGWDSEKTRLYGISWQTVQVEPWESHNSAHEEFRAFGGWHVLLMQVEPSQVRMFVDGRPVARHAGRNVPVVPMSINFNLWFSPGGLLPPSAEPRVYQQDVDWVFHASGATLSPAQVDAQVARWRRSGTARIDTVPAAQPALESRCDF